MLVSHEDSRRSNLNFEPQNTPDTSNSVFLPSASAERPVPTYTQIDSHPRLDFEAYLRCLDPGTIYLVEVLRSNPSQVIARARKHGIYHLQRCYQGQRGAPVDRFEEHQSLIIKHCPGLTCYPPGPNHAVESNSLVMEQLAMTLLAPPDDGYMSWSVNTEHPFPGFDDKPHTIIIKFLKRWRCQAKNKFQKYTSSYTMPLIKIQQKSGVRVPQLLNFDPQTATLISSDLGRLIELSNFFSPLRYLHVDSPDGLAAVGVVRQPQGIPPNITRWELESEASRQAYFGTIGTKLGAFLATLHGHRWQQRGNADVNPSQGEADLERKILRLGENLIIAQRSSLRFPVAQYDTVDAIDKAMGVLLADVSRKDHPEE
ncbi:uncharacterized protein A1O9_03634 [Exophiala aquamarina CBS 119918]|uniref:Aminoglycoside phosphotransferase domain-containing protein n=1 Tax=Exophiala aquamarina CBS 119918 TaxID=1182545 RepID=A0A072PG43_9EURO|nr:uncharacterized protein A1O9_03634 [Exophiala aquamarina CBS 119918]KEF58791.1 hypothetical protein A1O9_03634 [Exophiala aquamarina CBS 119918]